MPAWLRPDLDLDLKKRGRVRNQSARETGEKEWAKAIAGHAGAISDYLRTAALLDETAWRIPAAPGKWTPAEITEHLVRTYQVSLEQIRGGPGLEPRVGAFLRQILRLAILPRIFRTRRLPRGARAPREIRPIDPRLPLQKALEQLRDLGGEFEREMSTRRIDGELRLTHHIFGELEPVRGVDFIAIHIEHHGRQLSQGSHV